MRVSASLDLEHRQIGLEIQAHDLSTNEPGARAQDRPRRGSSRVWSRIGHEDPPVEVEVSRKDIVRYSVATEQQQQKYLSGDEAPLMFIFNLFGKPQTIDNLRPESKATVETFMSWQPQK